MPGQLKVVAFDVDAATMMSLRQAFPDWQIELIIGASRESIRLDWNPGHADLLVVGTHGPEAKPLNLCRALRSQVGRAHVGLVVLVFPGEEPQVRAALKVGADRCLVLPIHAKEILSVIDRVLGGNQPGRHTLSLDRAHARGPMA